MTNPSRRWLATGLVAMFAAAALLATPLAAQQGPKPPEIDDRTLGEEEQIQRRLEWFYSTRSAGTTSDSERAALRLEAVKQTGLAIERQRQLTKSGDGREQNVWVAKGPSPSTFGGWSFGNVSGRISSITADWDGNALYLGTASGGFWRSTNDGLSWTQLFDSAGTMTIGTAAVDPNDPSVIWVGTGENGRGCESYFGIGLMRSADGGTSWEARNGSGANTLENLATFADVIVDPRDSNHIITGGNIRGCADGSQLTGGLYTSDDGGLNWTKRLSLAIYEIAQDPSVLDTYWAATDGGIYKSTDNGLTWVQQSASGLPTSGGRAELAIAPSDSSTVYALFASGPAFWRTTDGGASWTQMSSGSNACDGQCWYNMVLRVHRTNPSIVYRGTIHIFKSTNGGSNWTDLSNSWGSSQTVHQDTHALLMHPSDAETFYVGGDGGIWKTTNGGNDFTNLNGNLNITQFYAVGVDANDNETICGGAQDNSSLARTTSNVWYLQAVTGDGFVCQIDSQNPNYAYITSYPSGGWPRVSRSSGGVLGSFSGITAGNGIIQNDRINWVTPYILDPVSPATLYLGTHRVYRSDNRGSNWYQVGPDDLTAGSGSLLSLEVNRTFPAYVYSGSASGRVWRTTNGGSDWTDITAGLPGRSINDIGADPSDPDRAFAVVGGFNTDHLWEWTAADGWTAAGVDLPNVPANSVLVLSALDVFVGTDTGVFRSVDGGQTFLPFMAGLPEGLVVTDLKYNQLQNILTAGTYGRGAWQVQIGPVGPIVLFDSIEQPPLEIAGDGDTNIEPGETWAVRVLLRNAGGETALGVEARLSTDHPGVILSDPDPAAFGDILSGETAGSLAEIPFTVDTAFTCGDDIVFDLLDLTTTNLPHDHADKQSIFSLTVLDDYGPPVIAVQFEEDFDTNPPTDWSHEAVSPGVAPCLTFPYFDEWELTSKDAEHGDSYHCGKGPGNTYGVRDHAWLYHGGRDSLGGAGIDIPADAASVSLTLVHWYDTIAGQDGGQVLVDGEDNGQDVYVTLTPDGGYPGGPLANGYCNVLEGTNAFQGSSGGWVTSTFDLSLYRGRRIWLAFVFASDYQVAAGEGWYIDQVKVESFVPGDPICQVTEWPGSVPPTVTFELITSGVIEASWDASCNVGVLPAQTYSIQAGDLEQLHESGAYSHAPIDDSCDRYSPDTFASGVGNEYYLLIPNAGGHEGGAGTDTGGMSRPSTSAVCGHQQAAECP